MLRPDNACLPDRTLAGALLLLLMSACHSAEINPPLTPAQIKVSNSLEACLTLEPLAIQSTAAGTMLDAKISHHKSLADCLCMTTLMNYQVFEERIIEGRTLRTEWVKGFKNTAAQQDGTTEFVLLTDPTYSPKGQLVLELRCRPHE